MLEIWKNYEIASNEIEGYNHYKIIEYNTTIELKVKFTQEVQRYLYYYYLL